MNSVINWVCQQIIKNLYVTILHIFPDFILIHIEIIIQSLLHFSLFCTYAEDFSLYLETEYKNVNTSADFGVQHNLDMTYF